MVVQKKQSKSCYIHIPFCKQICSYCDFCKVFYNEKLVDEYLDALEKEIKSKYKNEKIRTIYVGGGTPSSLNLKQLKRLFSIISILDREKDCEFTIECNFDNITIEKLKLFKEENVNRLSFGLETINQKCLKKLNRTLDTKYVKYIIEYCKNIGLNNINIDLMYAFIFSNINNLKKDLEFILSLDVQHISTYSLIIEEHTKLYLENTESISAEKDLQMYNYIHDVLAKEGYEHYEISNFCRSGYQSKHNLVYWKNEYYYGFGVGASSYIDNKRITNTRSISKYIKGVSLEKVENINKNDEMIYEMILGLRLSGGIDMISFFKKYKKRISDVFEVDSLLQKGYLIVEDNHLKIPFDKWYVSNSILVNFLEVKDE